MKIKLTCSLFLFVFCFNCLGQVTPWSQRMSSMAMNRWGLGNPSSWTYEKGLILKSIETVYKRTSNPAYLQYIQNNVNYFVTTSGNIYTYNPNDYNIDNINMGRSLLFLYNETGQTKYKTAAQKVRSQLLTHPRTSDGGFWHKQVYPSQMWLDGLYMGEPFYVEYSNMFSENNYDDIANQMILMEKHARDANTGLLYHGWDESKNQSWADPVTGCSPNFWGRSLGWYAMSLVDVLDHFPVDHTKRDTIVNILKRLATAVVNFQDPATGLWYQVVDKAGQAGNYKEASASCMFVYALAKGYRKGYLD